MDHIEEVIILFVKLNTPEKKKLANSITFMPFITDYLQRDSKEKALSSINKILLKGREEIRISKKITCNNSSACYVFNLLCNFV